MVGTSIKRHLSYFSAASHLPVIFKNSHNGLFSGKINFIESGRCQTVSMSLLSEIYHMPEFNGICFKFLLPLNRNYTFKTYVSNQIELMKDYYNQFAVATYVGKPFHKKINNDTSTLSMFTISIQDGTFRSNNTMTYDFVSEQVPFYWQSYGQFITVSIQTHHSNNAENHSI